MEQLIARAQRIGARLKETRETIAIAESSTGGVVSAALLAVPGASAYFLGGAVVYTLSARKGLLEIGELPQGMRASTEPYALLLARTVRARLGASWGLGETGATGPTGNRYGDAAGHTCLAVVGRTETSLTLETGSADRVANMDRFAAAALDLLGRCLGV
ncbi:MAG TPA: CinA family protein [Stellaceae bacterium]|nr:CinA family protein [Stellaceae bacterium]